jgi:hypothetical protein
MASECAGPCIAASSTRTLTIACPLSSTFRPAPRKGNSTRRRLLAPWRTLGTRDSEVVDPRVVVAKLSKSVHPPETCGAIGPPLQRCCAIRDVGRAV